MRSVSYFDYSFQAQPAKITFALTKSFLVQLAAILVSVLILTSISAGQSPDDDDPAPPPLRLLSREEKSQLESQSDYKRRLDAALRLMEGRMKKAEDLRTAENFDAMFLELGGFHGLMDNTLDFLNRETRQRGKALTYFKRYEIGLRTFTPRLALIRRDLPGRYDQYVLRLLKYLRDARSKAIEPFFGDTVLPNRPA